MLGGKDWANFFNNPENKKGLIKLVIKGRNIFEIPLIINSGENMFSVTEETIEVIPISSRKGADTMLVFHTRLNIKTAVVVTKYMDVFLLLI